MASFYGRWEQTERTNTGKLAEAFGIPQEKREAAQRDMCQETMIVRKEGDYYSFKITSPVGTRENKFRMGEEYEIVTSFANFKAIAHFEGEDKVVQRLSDPFNGHSVGRVTSQVLDEDTMTMITVEHQIHVYGDRKLCTRKDGILTFEQLFTEGQLDHFGQYIAIQGAWKFGVLKRGIYWVFIGMHLALVAVLI